MPGAAPYSALVARAQLGDREALEALLRALSPGLRRHLRGLLQEPSDADDALQETLWIVARRLGTLRDTAVARAWAYRIATREATHILRRSRKHRTEDLDETDEPVATCADVEWSSSGLDRSVLDLVNELPAKAQVVVRLRFIDDLSQQEIADALEIPLGTVKSRLGYGLNCLRELVQRSAAPHANPRDRVASGRARTP